MYVALVAFQFLFCSVLLVFVCCATGCVKENVALANDEWQVEKRVVVAGTGCGIWMCFCMMLVVSLVTFYVVLLFTRLEFSFLFVDCFCCLLCCCVFLCSVCNQITVVSHCSPHRVPFHFQSILFSVFVFVCCAWCMNN